MGPGWAPVNPAGNFDLTVFERLAKGGTDPTQPRDGDGASRPRRRRGPGLRAGARQLGRRGGGELPRGLSHRVDPACYAEAVAWWFGVPARLRFVPWEEWQEDVSEKEAEGTWDHIAHSQLQHRQAERLLGYQPRYSSLQAVRESLGWLIEHGEVEAQWTSKSSR